jgi:hypothetical protein
MLNFSHQAFFPFRWQWIMQSSGSARENRYSLQNIPQRRRTGQDISKRLAITAAAGEINLTEWSGQPAVII